MLSLTAAGRRQPLRVQPLDHVVRRERAGDQGPVRNPWNREKSAGGSSSGRHGRA
jgi:hypothetical protein